MSGNSRNPRSMVTEKEKEYRGVCVATLGFVREAPNEPLPAFMVKELDRVTRDVDDGAQIVASLTHGASGSSNGALVPGTDVISVSNNTITDDTTANGAMANGTMPADATTGDAIVKNEANNERAEQQEILREPGVKDENNPNGEQNNAQKAGCSCTGATGSYKDPVVLEESDYDEEEDAEEERKAAEAARPIGAPRLRPRRSRKKSKAAQRNAPTLTGPARSMINNQPPTVTPHTHFQGQVQPLSVNLASQSSYLPQNKQITLNIKSQIVINILFAMSGPEICKHVQLTCVMTATAPGGISPQLLPSPNVGVLITCSRPVVNKNGSLTFNAQSEPDFDLQYLKLIHSKWANALENYIWPPGTRVYTVAMDGNGIDVPSKNHHFDRAKMTYDFEKENRATRSPLSSISSIVQVPTNGAYRPSGCPVHWKPLGIDFYSMTAANNALNQGIRWGDRVLQCMAFQPDCGYCKQWGHDATDCPDRAPRHSSHPHRQENSAHPFSARPSPSLHASPFT